MDLVNIGFLIKADGLKEANQEVDKLLTKVDEVGKKGVVSADKYESGQKKIRQSTAQTSSVVLSSSEKMMERQRNLNALLPYLDKSTAGLAASFYAVNKNVNEFNQYLDLLERNKAIETQKKQAEDLVKQQKKMVDAQEKARQRMFAAEQKEYIKQQEAIRKSQEAELNKINQTNAARQKAIELEEKKAKYMSQGMTATTATKVARMEVSGADVDTLNSYRAALEKTITSKDKMAASSKEATSAVGKFIQQAKGVAVYAVMSAVIYKVITSITALGVAMVKHADEYSMIQSRMKLYVQGTEELAAANRQLLAVSMNNNVGLREASTLFARLSTPMQKLGATTKDTIRVVDTFSKAMMISGVTSAEAASATLQFSQAMQSGVLSGDEFRAMTEAAPRLLKAIADGAGIAAEDLKKMAADQMLSSELVIKALQRQADAVDSEYGKVAVTLDRGLNAVKTSFTAVVGEFNEGAKVTETLGLYFVELAANASIMALSAKEAGQSFSEVFKDAQPILTGVLNVLKAYVSFVVSRFLVSQAAIATSFIATSIAAAKQSVNMIRASAALGGTTVATAALTAAMARLKIVMDSVNKSGRGGWIGLVTTIGLAVAAYTQLSSATEKQIGHIITEADELDGLIQKYKEMSELEKEKAKIELGVEQTKNAREYRDELEKLEKSLYNIANPMHGLSRHEDDYKRLRDMVRSTEKDGFVPLMAAISKNNILTQEQKEKYITLIKSLQEKQQVQKLGIQLMDAYNGKVNDSINSVLGLVDAQTKLQRELRRTGSELADTAMIMRKYGLEESTASKVAAERRAAIDSMVQDNQAKIIAAEKDIERLRKAGGDTTAHEARLQQIKTNNLKIYEKQVDATITKNSAAAAQYMEGERKKLDAYNKTQREMDKPVKTPKEPKKGDINNYPEQIENLKTLLSYLQQGTDEAVARAAVEKDYIKWYGASLDMAKQRVALEKAIADEATRSKSKSDLDSRLDDLKSINSLMVEGYNLTDAQAIVTAKLASHTDKALYAERMRGETIGKLMQTKQDEINQSLAINNYLQKGLSLDEARLYLNASLVKAESEGNIELLKTLVNLEKTLNLRNAENDVLSESNKLQKLAYVYASQTSNEMADLIANNEGVSIEALAELKTRGDILKIVKEYNDILEKQSKESPFADINFDVFGSIGNPFESALNGLHDFIGGLDKLKDSYMEAKKLAQKDVNDALEGSDEKLKAIAILKSVDEKYAMDKAVLEERMLQNSVNSIKGFTKEHTFAYKAASATEKGFQLYKIAQATKAAAISLGLISAETGAYIKGSIARVAAEKAATANSIALSMKQAAASAVAALAASLQAPPPANLVSFATVSAILASIGVAVKGGKASGKHSATNEGKGTVFGDNDAKSESIKKSIDALRDNSSLMLPLTTSMATSLKNIESNISGLTNLIIRQGVGTKSTITGGFEHNTLGNALKGLTSVLGLGGLFGTKTTIKGQGLMGVAQSLEDIMKIGMQLNEYTDYNVKKKTFGVTTSNKNKTQISAAEEEIEKQFQLIFTGFYDTIISSAKALGQDTKQVQSLLESAVVDIGKIDLKGLSGQEIAERLSAVFGAAGDKLAIVALGGLQDFQKVGEGYLETIVRVSTGVEQATHYTNLLGVAMTNYKDIANKQGDVTLEIVRQSVLADAAQKRQAEAWNNLFEGVYKGSRVISQFRIDLKKVDGGFEDMVSSFSGTASELVSFVKQLRDLQSSLALTGKEGKYLTQVMIQGAGDIQALSKGFSSYYDMLSAQEQATHLTSQLTSKFKELGMVLPDSVQGYKDLLSGINVTTKSGQKLYGQLISLAPEFTDLQSALKRAEDEANALKKEAEDLAEAERKAAEEAAKYAATLAEIREAMYVTRQDGKYLSEAMINAAGGTDELLKGLQAYFNMLDPAEQATELTRRMTNEFKALGQELPKGTDGFRDMIHSLDLSTKSGQELYGQLMALTPEFNALQSALKAAEDAEKSRLEALKVEAKLLSDLRAAMYVTKQSGKNLTQTMIDAADGTDFLSAGLQAYFNMLSPVEQVEELTRRLNVEFSALGVKLPDSVEGFRKLVEGIDTNTEAGKKLYGQIIALTPEFKELQDMIESVADVVSELDLDKIRTQFEMLGKGSKYLTTNLVESAGGIDELSSALGAYFNILTPQEQALELTRRMTKEFSNLGLSLPSSIDGFKELVDSIDISTTSGQNLLGQVLALTSGFVEMQNAVDRVKEEADKLAQSLSELKFAFEMTGKDSKYLTMSIAEAAGGIDKLASGLSAYFDMLSPQEQAIELTRRLTSQFKDIGQVLPDSVDGFKALISSIDVTTDEGKKLYGQVIALAPEFNSLQSALESANNEVNGLVKSLRELAEEARKARGEQDKPQNLNITRWQFEQAAQKAMLGDVEAAQQLLTLGKDLMQLSSVYASSSEEYARDLAMIDKAASVSADVQEGTGGSLQGTLNNLTPAVGTGNTPTIDTVSTTTDDKIELLREDLNAALLAIARYTQDTSRTLERWDYGDRMVVRIEQDNIDDSIPVKVVP